MGRLLMNSIGHPAGPSELGTQPAHRSRARQNRHHRGMRTFNTVGPVAAADHYCVPPLDRPGLDSALKLIQNKKYFILHGPLQSGKTSALLALADSLNSGVHGEYRCVYANVGAAREAREDISPVVTAVIGELEKAGLRHLKDESLKERCAEALARGRPDTAIARLLTAWAQSDPRPLVLLVDEIDCLRGDGLLTVLRQLRAGYDRRPSEFPQSIVLCGLRDVREWRIRSASTGHVVAGDSAFNIGADAVQLGNFSRAEVDLLLAQYTAESGREFEPAAVNRVWVQTRGQPGLVNALCRRACDSSEAQQLSAHPVTENDLWEAQEHVLQERGGHLGRMAVELEDGRVQRMLETLLMGTPVPHVAAEDVGYARDLGLIARDDDPQRIANAIYREAVPRYLTSAVQAELPIQPERFVDAAGGLDLHGLLEDFRDYFRQRPERWSQQVLGYEVGPQLFLQAYLQKVVSGGGWMLREYGLGRGRTDLLVVWRQGDKKRRFVVECMECHGGVERLIRVGAVNTGSYMKRCGAEAGHLVLFDPTQAAWKDKPLRRLVRIGQTKVEVWGI